MVFVGLVMSVFGIFEFIQRDMISIAQVFSDPAEELRASHLSTITSMVMALILVGMMRRRFIFAERSLAQKKSQTEGLLRAVLPNQSPQSSEILDRPKRFVMKMSQFYLRTL